MTQPYRPEELRGELYPDGADRFRWRLRNAGNHLILADSGQGYGNPDRPDLGRRYAREMFGRLFPGVTLELLEEDPELGLGPLTVNEDEAAEE